VEARARRGEQDARRERKAGATRERWIIGVAVATLAVAVARLTVTLVK
jgi:hypothetical protein